MNKRLIQQISREMKAQGVTRAELARRIGVDRTLISRWLNGRQLPPLPRLQEIANILRIDLVIPKTNAAGRRRPRGQRAAS